jgi:predicted ribosome quality control (RQC) complex YloA/Tae2 family protein
MPFDAVMTRAVVDDLRAHLLGGRVDKILQAANLTVALLIRAEQANQWLVLSADARQARVQRTLTRQINPFGEPSPFIMLLRKHLEGARLQNVAQQGVDRVLTLTFYAGPEEPVLLAEVMGRYSNVILVDQQYVVLGALKQVRADENRYRVVLPRHPYLPPPRPMRPPPHADRPKLDPLYATGGELAVALGDFDDATLLWKAVLDSVDGLSPVLAREVVFLVTGGVETTLAGRRDLTTATTLIAQVRRHFGPGRGQPSAIWQGVKLAEYAAFPLRQYGVEPRLYADLAGLLDEAFAAPSEVDSMTGQRRPVVAQIEALRAALQRKITSLEAGISSLEELATLRTRGEMVLAYQHTIAPGQRELVIPELHLTISLDPEQTPLENAQRLFKRYQKARDAAAVVPGLLEAARQDLAYLDQLLVHASLASDPAALAAVRADLRLATVEREAQPAQKRKPNRRDPRAREGKGKPGLNPLQVRTTDGMEILVGRSARQNDAVTFDLAAPQDLWFHARQIPGAHVILRVAGRSPTREALLQAATLAATYSQARGATTVPVDYTPVRNVRRIKGGKPGLVHYSGETTLQVHPGS